MMADKFCVFKIICILQVMILRQIEKNCMPFYMILLKFWWQRF